MKTIPLTKGYVALVDDTDYDLLSQWKWTASVGPYTVYAYRKSGPSECQQNILMHRVILQARLGARIDHWDGNGLHNWRGNLRFCTPRQNMLNQRIRSDNTSGYRGVGWQKRERRWRVKLFGKTVGYFKAKDDAVEFRTKQELEHYGEWSPLLRP